jgi:site-specific recombinase XerD
VKQRAGLQRLDKKKVITKDEFDRIRTCATTTKEKLFLDIPYETGCTLNELTGIKVKDIEFTTSSLTIGQRKISLSRRLQQEIQYYLSEEQSSQLSSDTFLFSTRQSTTISEKRVYQITRELSGKAGLSSCPRLLRNSHVSHAIQSGRPLQDIAAKTGIKHLEKFNLYGLLRGDHD